MLYDKVTAAFLSGKLKLKIFPVRLVRNIGF